MSDETHDGGIKSGLIERSTVKSIFFVIEGFIFYLNDAPACFTSVA